MTTLLLRRAAAAAALMLTFASPTRGAAQVPLAPGSWMLFEWFFGVGPVDGNGFTLDATQRTSLRVTDDGVSGDAYDIFINGVLFGGTPTMPGGVFTGAFDGDAAWAHPALSKTQLFLNPGQYTITLAVREAGSGFDFGEGFIRADAAPIGVVPEPATVVMMFTGLVGVGIVMTRGRRRIG
jgi:hypothetical protein